VFPLKRRVATMRPTPRPDWFGWSDVQLYVNVIR